MKLKIAMAVLLAMCATPASAETCEALILKVDKALETTKASPDNKEKAKRLRNEGETQRASGGDCETALSQALKLLGE